MARDGNQVLLVISGTLGDILPAAALAASLQRAGVDVTVASYKRYQHVFAAVSHYHSLPFDFLEVMQGHSAQQMLAGGWPGRRSIGMYRSVRPLIRPMARMLAPLFRQHASAVVAGVPFGVLPLARHYRTNLIRLYYQPHWPNADYSSLYITRQFKREWMRRKSHDIVEAAAQIMFGSETRMSLALAAGIDTPGDPRCSPPKLLNDSYWAGLPTIFAVPPAFCHEAGLRAANAIATGFVRPLPLKPTREYSEFLEAIEKARRPLVYCAFGSMRTHRASRVLGTVVSAARDSGVTVVTSADGVPYVAPHVVTAPFGDHRALFPLCDAIIHHGGAGTLAASIESGRPFCIVPQWADQFFWEWRTVTLGLSVPHVGSAFSARGWRRTLDALLGSTVTEWSGGLAVDGVETATTFIRDAMVG